MSEDENIVEDNSIFIESSPIEETKIILELNKKIRELIKTELPKDYDYSIIMVIGHATLNSEGKIDRYLPSGMTATNIDNIPVFPANCMAKTVMREVQRMLDMFKLDSIAGRIPYQKEEPRTDVR